MAAYAPLDGDRAGRTRLPRQRLGRARDDRRADFGRQCQGGGGCGIGACADRGTNDRRTTEGDKRGGVIQTPSFRGDAKHRTTMRNCASENLEIPGSRVARPGMTKMTKGGTIM